MDKSLEKEIERRTAMQKVAMEANPPAPLPASPTAFEGRGNTNSSKTLEKLRGLTQNLNAQLAEARQAHIVKITTMATELVDVQRDHIKELELENEKLLKELTYYRTWEESREVAELVEKIKELEADLEALGKSI